MFRQGQDPEQAPRPFRAMIRDVPHFLLGRVEGSHDVTIHVLFPHLRTGHDKFVSLTDEQYTRWFDRIFHPAVHRHYAAHYTQHLPASFRHAFANSKAHQVEARQIETASYQAQLALGYHLQPQHLGAIWADVCAASATTPGLRDFRDPQLFLSAKDTKLRFKSTADQPSLLDVMDRFEAYLGGILDLDQIDEDRFFVDVAKEICPGVSLLAGQTPQVDEQPQVYSWRRCCLEEHAKRMYDGQPPTKGGAGQCYYPQHMLHDAGSLTSVPPKRSLLSRGGVPYFQCYPSVKEIWDAAKCMPFDNDGAEEMALDPQIRQAARNLLGGRRREAHIMERAHCASKRRAHVALRASRQKSFGLREEYRVALALYRRMKDRLRQIPPDDLVVSLDDCPSYAWAVKTEVHLGFVWRSLDKFATGFEVIRARCRQDLVTWEQTKMMAMFLRCLRFVLGGQRLRHESALWWSRRERQVGNPPQQRVWYGLGFCNTLSRYGYCWLEPRFNWEELVFRSAVTDRVLFGNSTLRGRYLRRGGSVRDFFQMTQRLELALTWLKEHHRHTRIRDRLIYWMVHCCLQQFRIDILGSVAGEIQEGHRQEALLGTTPFCHEYFEEIMIEGVYLSSGNRSDLKVASHLGHCLFDFGDGDHWNRQHWEHRPFRKLYRRARTALGAQFGDRSEVDRTFGRRFWRCLYAYHWLLPHPAGGVLLQTSKEGHRMWYSIRTRENLARDNVEPHQWEWARKDWQTGRPTALPEYVHWERDAWEGWIEQQRRRYADDELNSV